MTEGPLIKGGAKYIRCNVEWNGSKARARLCSSSREDSKDCVTFYMPIQSERVDNSQEGEEKWRNLLGIKLLTGRKHQIRCHLSEYLDNPIINDTKYKYKPSLASTTSS